MNILGLDLGQTTDYSALCFLQRTEAELDIVKEPLRCRVTGKQIGAEPIPGKPCLCENCKTLIKKTGNTFEELKAVETSFEKHPPAGEFTDRMNSHRAGDPNFDLDEDRLPELPLKDRKRNYNCRLLKRWRLGTSYVDIVKDVKKACQHPTIVVGPSVLVVDNTGVGRPVVDMFRRAKLSLRIVPITITGGREVTEDQHEIHVPKIELISAVQVLLQTGRIGFAAGMPEVDTLLQELRDYRVKVSAAANEIFNAREGKHDDLVLAFALAAFFGERCVQRLRSW